MSSSAVLLQGAVLVLVVPAGGDRGAAEASSGRNRTDGAGASDGLVTWGIVPPGAGLAAGDGVVEPAMIGPVSS